MAINAGTSGANRAQDPNREPYYKRIQPIDGGYTLTQADGRPLGGIRVFDDRADSGVIHVQFSTGRGQYTKVSTFHCDSVAEYNDIMGALALATKQF